MSTAKKARECAYRLLKFRNRSEKEIRDKFIIKKYPGEIIEEVISHLKKIGLIDDRKFAQEWVNFRLKVPFGLKRIILELRQKGIAPDIITDLTQDAQVKGSEEQGLSLVAERRLRYLQKHEKDKVKVRRKLYYFLLRRGFSPGDCLETIDRILSLKDFT